MLAGFDERNSKGGIKRIQTGVHFMPRRNTELLFITLEKSEKHCTPTTLYNDYPISPTRFHWETQSNCHEETSSGSRYLAATRGAPSSVVLFVRPRRKGERGETRPYVCLGRAFYRSHRGARPTQIEWDLEHPMPASLYQETKRAAGRGGLLRPPRARVMEGLGEDRKKSALGALVKQLAPRWFVVRDAKDSQPSLLNPRWAMSYLRGPMTQSEIRRATRGEGAGGRAE